MSHIIKEFAEFDTIPEQSIWLVKVTSHANTHGLTAEQIENIFLGSFNSDKYKAFKQKMNLALSGEGQSDEFKKSFQKPKAKWQVAKSNEVEESFFNNLKYSIVGETIEVDTEFQVKLLESFNREEVIDWVEGMNRIPKVHLYVSRYNDGDLHDREWEFLQELNDNEDINAVKL